MDIQTLVRMMQGMPATPQPKPIARPQPQQARPQSGTNPALAAQQAIPPQPAKKPIPTSKPGIFQGSPSQWGPQKAPTLGELADGWYKK